MAGGIVHSEGTNENVRCPGNGGGHLFQPPIGVHAADRKILERDFRTKSRGKSFRYKFRITWLMRGNAARGRGIQPRGDAVAENDDLYLAMGSEAGAQAR